MAFQREVQQLEGAKTALEIEVQDALNEMAEENYPASALVGELLSHGCQSGVIGGMVYYSDTCEFFERHKDEIEALLKETLDDCGIKSPAELFGDKWDATDFFARAELNQNLLAWFGFEETARKLADINGIEV